MTTTTANAYTNARRLTGQELNRLESSDSWPIIKSMLRSFGHGVDDLRMDDSARQLVYPLAVQQKLNSIKAGRISMISRVSSADIGMVVIMRDLSEHALNGKEFRIVKVFPEEDKILIDVTPNDWSAAQVRYVKVSAFKRSLMHVSPSRDGFMFRACMQASNRDRVFAAAGFVPANIECLAVRPHPDVEYGRMWRDVPRLCDKLNRDRVVGHPFTTQFGFQVFAECSPDVATVLLKGGDDVNFESLYTSEPYLILRDCRGCGIDVAPDLYTNDGSEEQCLHKFFIPDDRICEQSWNNVTEAVRAFIESGMMSTADVAAVSFDLNQSWPAAIICHTFSDSVLTFPNRRHFNLQQKLVNLRRGIVVGGGVMLSRSMATKIATDHANDHVAGGGIVNREDAGTMCVACYMRITDEETKACDGCGKANYCSRSCQLWHWREHKACCVSKEERERRRAVAAAARAARVEQLRRHDECESLARAEEAQKEAERKAQVARGRAERAGKHAAELAERIRRAAPQAQKAPTATSNKKKSKKEDKLIHAAWDSVDEREARTAAFVAKQESEHADAEERKARDTVDRLKKLEADASAAREAATHCVPCAPTLGDVLGSVRFVGR